ncbi:sulfite exporter TauE/SafE family protein [Falsirhodobacter sp. 20TX0035]|uniref:sulfite exporter TauE/SafE family protein n=1 Tax=Falsirhodobacter sp. 20TX0035 TaxID=3022019 RepID=UPI00232F8EC7|nr:sulfite exporter TauE/SafE family protein [Falsirhodobacter sp. 20TX0035]MDB6455016.1 sulfite exporter TauE/SafE family protein [Falsirhodobacter sp. 20TX0035]
MDSPTILLSIAFLITAMVYAAVGQAGASGYIAILGLAGFSPLAMKTTALSLNLLVAAIGTALFLRAGRLSWRNVWPFALLGFPFSMLGGALHLPESIYFPLVGAVLILSGFQMARTALFDTRMEAEAPVTPPFTAALAVGAVIGFVSGTTGTGGGVFLAPVILTMRWATARQAAATTAVYNLMNSCAALLGAYAAWGHIPSALPAWLVAVAVGGTIGAYIGSRYLSDLWLRGILSILLFMSGVKLVW